MAFALVYTADHFVFDIFLGWAYVIATVVAFRLIRKRRPQTSGASEGRSPASERQRTSE
jgi:hypothetical protein